MNEQITFVVGGCRSGKSTSALNQADRMSGKNKYFIATSVPTDIEMELRVVKHQKERGSDWQTIEEPVEIDKWIQKVSPKASVILVDCLTLWVSNLLFQLKEPDLIDQAICNLEQALKQCKCPIFLVSNEVGYGIVPENQLARQFRDLAGSVNQRVARIAHRVILTVAGIDVQIKPRP
ncbi:MAG: bifunctional adenosylcobinamide kinase/adenosylcobinamide-phosphate guanylyltransferase [Pseudomonadota bacterium]